MTPITRIETTFRKWNITTWIIQNWTSQNGNAL